MDMCKTIQFFVLAFLHHHVSSIPLGSKCRNADISGTCALITDCEVAFDAVRKSGRHTLKRCGFEKFTEIVCCPNPELRHPKPSTEEPEVRGNQKRKSEKQCEKYSNNLPIVLTYHIVGGEDAEVGEFPHMAAMGFYYSEEKNYHFSCGGTLISHKFIVTAAHCVVNIQQNDLKIVRLGAIDVPEIVEEPNATMDYNVANVTVHSEYKWKEKFNDIALVRLEKKVTFSDTIRPACLYTKNDVPLWLMVTGWGVVELGGDRSSRLQKASLSPVPLDECKTTYQIKASRNITQTQLCAVHNVSDACQGDSGGPLQTTGTGSILTIVGVTSYGIGCGSRHPGIYTRISSYIDWIENIVWP